MELELPDKIQATSFNVNVFLSISVSNAIFTKKLCIAFLKFTLNWVSCISFSNLATPNVTLLGGGEWVISDGVEGLFEEETFELESD